MLTPLLASLLSLGVAHADPDVELEYDFRFGGSINRNEGPTNYPSGIAIDPFSGGSFVMDLLNNRIKYYDADGAFSHYWLCQQGLGLTVDPRNGVVWVAMWKNHTVNAYSPTGVLLTTLGTRNRAGNGEGEFSSPYDVAIDGETGELYVLDTGNARVQVFDIDLVAPEAAYADESTRRNIVVDWPRLWLAVFVDDFEGDLTALPSTSALGRDLGEQLAEVRSIANEIEPADTIPTATFDRAFDLSEDGPALSTPYSIAIHPEGEFLVVVNTGQGALIQFEPDGTIRARWQRPMREESTPLRRGDAMGSASGDLRWPQGVAIDAAGMIYVTDTDNERIQIFDTTGTDVRYIQSPDGASGAFHPRALDVHPDGSEIRITATAANRIDRFDATDSHIGSFGERDIDTGVFNQLKGITIDGEAGRIYLSDWMDHRIRVFDMAGQFTGTISPEVSTPTLTSGAELSEDFASHLHTQVWSLRERQSFPGAMDIDVDGNLWLLRGSMVYADDPTNEARWLVRSFDSEGNLQSGFGHRFFPRNARMRGIAVDPETTDVYVANSMRHSVMKFDAAGTLLWEAGTPGTGDEEFDHPTGIALSPDGARVYIIDAKNHRIQVLDADGNFVDRWGEAGTEAGQFDFAQFNGLDVDERGYLYIGDSKNNRVQVLDDAGNFVTEFGQPGPGGIGHYRGIPDVEVHDDRLYVLDSARGRVEVYQIHYAD